MCFSQYSTSFYKQNKCTVGSDNIKMHEEFVLNKISTNSSLPLLRGSVTHCRDKTAQHHLSSSFLKGRITSDALAQAPFSFCLLKSKNRSKLTNKRRVRTSSSVLTASLSPRLSPFILPPQNSHKIMVTKDQFMKMKYQ